MSSIAGRICVFGWARAQSCLDEKGVCTIGGRASPRFQEHPEFPIKVTRPNGPPAGPCPSEPSPLSSLVVLSLDAR
ncbi:hypothetical protein BDZ45DRAFT_811782 [Acephala macrosclerotiorum]|nr:hypothetical protein BDZ45DRAFT_811782 [Acephala macrosclerotiorum]